MTIEEASKEWNKTVKTIKQWIKDERIPYKMEDGNIRIPDIEKPHIIRRDIKLNDKKVRDHIVEATKNFEYIDAKAFMGKLKPDKFAEYMDVLEEEGKLRRIKEWKDNKSNRWYIYDGDKKKAEQKNALKMKKAEKPVSITFNPAVNVGVVDILN